MSKITKAQILKLNAFLPHFSVLAHGSESEKQGLLSGVSPDFIKVAEFLTEYLEPKVEAEIMSDDKKKKHFELIKSPIRADRKTMKLREIVKGQEGGDLASVMSSIGKTALQLAPTIAPLLLAL